VLPRMLPHAPVHAGLVVIRRSDAHAVLSSQCMPGLVVIRKSDAHAVLCSALSACKASRTYIPSVVLYEALPRPAAPVHFAWAELPILYEHGASQQNLILVNRAHAHESLDAFLYLCYALLLLLLAAAAADAVADAVADAGALPPFLALQLHLVCASPLS